MMQERLFEASYQSENSPGFGHLTTKPEIWRVAEAAVKKIQVLRHENVPLKHYTFPRTLKNI